MSDQDQGAYAATLLREALEEVGFPPSRIATVGLTIAQGLEQDEAFIGAFREEFAEEAQKSGKGVPLDPFEPMAPSEHLVVEDLLRALEEATGDRMPWIAEPALVILDEYETYLNEVNAAPKLKERLERLRHAVLDLEMRASGRA